MKNNIYMDNLGTKKIKKKNNVNVVERLIFQVIGN